MLALAALLPFFAFASASARAAALSFIPCAGAAEFQCSSLAVPLDRSGALSGTISLSVERKLAGVAPSRTAVVALAGGPGQAALPLGAFIAQAIAPALGTRDLLVFDQRGTGSSDPLSCGAFEQPSLDPPAVVFEQCANELGPARGAFTTEESVQDIEALRQAGGYEKLVLYGTSYGTKVAEQYAEQYPQNVEALVLDSVVPPEGSEPFAVPSFEAVGGVLEELCAGGACAGITPNPVASVAQLAARLRTHALSGSVYNGSGHRYASSIDEQGLFDVLEAGDLNPALRALLPAAVTSALRRDPDPLLRLQALAQGLIPNVPVESPNPEAQPEIDEALFAATSCEESPFPWQRSADTSTRMSEALAYLNAQPSADFYPFDAATAYANSLIPDCAGWPDASPPPPAQQPLPDVPTLILSGAQDLRTPTSNARALAARIADAQLLVVPFTGHSVLGSDLSGCSALAVEAFFSNTPVTPCANTPNQFAPTPVTPTSLAGVHPPASLPGRAGKTLVAVLDTLVDLNRQVIAATLQADATLPSGSSFGGLHGGYAKLTRTVAKLERLSFVPGVALTASFPVRDGKLQATEIHVSGSQAAAGEVRFGSSSQVVTGALGASRFSVDIAKVKLARRSATGEWPSLASVQSRLGRLAGAARAAGDG